MPKNVTTEKPEGESREEKVEMEKNKKKVLLKVNQEMRHDKRMRRISSKAPTLQLPFQFVIFGRDILTELFQGFSSTKVFPLMFVTIRLV